MDLALTLEDPEKPQENLGDIYLSATLYPRSQEDKDQVSTFIIYFIVIIQGFVDCWALFNFPSRKLSVPLQVSYMAAK